MQSEDKPDVDSQIGFAIKRRVERFEKELREAYGDPPSKSLGRTAYDYIGGSPKLLSDQQKLRNLISSIESFGDE